MVVEHWPRTVKVMLGSTVDPDVGRPSADCLVEVWHHLVEMGSGWSDNGVAQWCVQLG